VQVLTQDKSNKGAASHRSGVLYMEALVEECEVLICIYTYVCIYVCMYVCMYVCIYVCMYIIFIHVCVSMHISVWKLLTARCLYVFMCMYSCVTYMCVYMYLRVCVFVCVETIIQECEVPTYMYV